MTKSLMIIILGGLLFFSQSSLAVIGGKLAQENSFDAVGAVYMAGEIGCTATLIAERWIVTANHCTFATEGGEDSDLLPISDYEFRVGADSKKPAFKSQLKRWVRLESQDEEDAMDVAFGELVDAVPIVRLNIAAAVVVTPVWTREDLQQPYTHIGYGEDRRSEGKSWRGLRQKANLTVTASRGNALLSIFGNMARLEAYVKKFHPDTIEAASFEAVVHLGELLEGYTIHAWDPRGRTDLRKISIPQGGWQDTCFGDSGGPLLRQKNGRLEIVGVVSSGMNRICEPMGTKFATFGPKIRDLMKTLGL